MAAEELTKAPIDCIFMLACVGVMTRIDIDLSFQDIYHINSMTLSKILTRTHRATRHQQPKVRNNPVVR